MSADFGAPMTAAMHIAVTDAPSGGPGWLVADVLRLRTENERLARRVERLTATLETVRSHSRPVRCVVELAEARHA